MITTEGRNKNSRDIACSRKEVLTRTLENPWYKQGTRDNKSPPEPRHKRRQKNNPETRAETPEEIGQSNKQLVHNDIKVTFNSGFLETFHIGHGWEASARNYPSCRTMHLVKLKYQGRSQPSWIHQYNYGRIIHLTEKPRVGLRWQAQDKKCRPSEGRVEWWLKMN